MAGPGPKLKKISAAPKVTEEGSGLSGNINFSKVPAFKTRVIQNYDGTYTPVEGYDFNSKMVARYGEDWVRNWGVDIGVEVGKVGVSALQMAPGASGLKVVSFAVTKTATKGGLTSLGQYLKGEDVTLKKNLISEFATPSNMKGYGKIDVATQTGFLNKGGAIINNTGYIVASGFESTFGTTGKFTKIPGSGGKDFKLKVNQDFVFKEPTLSFLAPQKTLEKTYAKKLSFTYKGSHDETDVSAQLEKYVEGWASNDWISFNRLISQGGYTEEEAVHAINKLNEKYDVSYAGSVIGWAEQTKWETRNTWATKQAADYFWEQGTKTKDEAVKQYYKAKDAFKNGEILEGLKATALVGLNANATFTLGTLWGGFEFLRTSGEGLVTGIAGGTSIIGKVGQVLDGVIEGALPKYQPHVFVTRNPDGSLRVIGVDYEDSNLRTELGYAKNVRTAVISEEERTKIIFAEENNAIGQIHAPNYFSDGTKAPTWSNISEPEETINEETQVITLDEVVVTAKSKKSSTPVKIKDKYGREWTFDKKGNPVSYVEKGETWQYNQGISYQEVKKNGRVVDTVYKSTGDYNRANQLALQRVDVALFSKQLQQRNISRR